MRPPWSQQAADAELEALQTDVMRFIAILGLCLAAIFSLVHSAAQQEAAVAVGPAAAPEPRPVPVHEPDPVTAALAAPAISLEPEPRPRPRPRPTPTIAAPQEESGFTLEFASDAAMLGLLESGELGLLANVGGQFWLLDSSLGAFSATSAPDSYYGMLEETVPATLRRKLLRDAGDFPGEWGVRLTPGMVGQLQQIMRERRGGKLLIQPDGGIRVELAASPQPGS